MKEIEVGEYACVTCKEPGGWNWAGKHYCMDCWPGYNLCKRCTDYRCEHLGEMCEGECHCGCPSFVEGSTERIVNRKEFAALVKSWKAKGDPHGKAE